VTDASGSNQSAGPSRPERLNELLILERESDGVFVSRCSEPNLVRTLFGGQLMGQSIAAADDDVPSQRRLRRLHATFARALPLEPHPRYRVRTVLEGKTFSLREVAVSASDGIAFTASLTFQDPENGPSHTSPPAADFGPPESFPTVGEFASCVGDRLSA
jgi:acyl-CoA thioesterase-2